MTHRLRNVPRGLVLENDDTQSRVNSDSNLSQNRLKRTMRQASWTKPRKLWAWYSQRMKIRRCHRRDATSRRDVRPPYQAIGSFGHRALKCAVRPADRRLQVRAIRRKRPTLSTPTEMSLRGRKAGWGQTLLPSLPLYIL